MRTMAQKRAALAEVIEITLQAVDSDYRVVQRIREATLRNDDVKGMIRIMGSGLKYCEVIYAGRTTGLQNSLNRSGIVTHRFKVNIWMRFEDSDTEADSSQTAFDAVTEGDHGLLNALDQYDSIRDDDPEIEPLLLGRPEAVVVDLVPIESRGNDMFWAHYMTFEIAVTDTRAERLPIVTNQTPEVEETPSQDTPLPGFEITGTEGDAGLRVQAQADDATFTEGTETLTVNGETFVVKTVTVPVL